MWLCHVPADTGTDSTGAGFMAHHCRYARCFSPVIAQPGRYPMVLRHFHRQPAVTLLVWLLLISIAWGTLRASGLLKYDHKVYRQRNALRLVCLEFVLFIGVMLLLTLIPHAILLNVMGGYASSSFSRSILPYICLMVIVMAQSFGVVSQRLNSIEAMGEAMADGVRLSAPLFIIYILVIQLYSSVDYLF